ncbi:MAG: hypothetical protein IKO80_10025 [Lachnospiraceae bacterium]|nr:hypothetical protein [Lachnospiraceae bacterium]
MDLAPAGPLVFSDLKQFVTPTETKEVTLTNRSPFAIRISGITSEYFETVEEEYPILVSGASYTYHVKAKSGLAAGTYEDIMTFRDTDGIEKTIALSVRITSSDAKAEFTDHATEGNPEAAVVEFDELGDGYDETMLEPETVTIKNTGLCALTFKNATATNYTVTMPEDRTIAVGESMEFEIAPKLNLAVGEHDEEISIQTVEGFTLSLTAKFEVIEAAASAEFLTRHGYTHENPQAYPLPLPIRYGADGTDATWASSFRIKNTGNVRFKITDITDNSTTKNLFDWPEDQFIYPGKTADISVTIGHEETERYSNATITFAYADGTTGTSKAYFIEKAGLAGTYSATELKTLSENADLYRLVDDTEVELEEGDDITVTPPAKGFGAAVPVELRFKGSDDGKLTFDTDMPSSWQSAKITLKVEGGDIHTKKTVSMWNGKIMVTGGSFTGDNSDLYYGLMEVDEAEVTGGVLRYGSNIVAGSKFTATGGRTDVFGIQGSGVGGIRYVPEVTIGGDAYVHIAGSRLAADQFSISAGASLKASNSSGNVAVCFKSVPDMGEGISILSPAGGHIAQYTRNSDTFYTVMQTEDKPASSVRIGSSSAAGNASFTVDKTTIRFDPVYEGQYDPSVHQFPEEMAATVTVTNTGDTDLDFSVTVSDFHVESVGNKYSAQPGETIVLKIIPQYGLSVGTYERVITITADTGDTKAITATCEITEPTYQISVTPQTVDFGEIFEGENYTSATVTVSNPGDMKQVLKVPEVSGDTDKFTVTGLPTEEIELQSGKSISFTVIPDKEQLTEGTAALTISLETEHGETADFTAKAGVTSIAPGTIFLRPIPALKYNGKAQKPEPEVYYGSVNNRLSPDDYTVSYSNNTNAGNPESVKNGKSIAPTITVKGKGNFKDSVSAAFTIDPISMSEVYTDADEHVNANRMNAHITVAYTGNAIRITPVLKCDIDGKTVILKKGTDYTLDKESVTTSGTIRATGIGNYSGVKDIKVNVVQNRTLITAATFAAIPAQKYTGKNIVLADPVNASKEVRAQKANGTGDFEWSITCKGKPVAPENYALFYADNKEIGTATVYVFGKNDFAGMVTKTFKITGTALSAVKMDGFEASLDFTGSVRKQTGVKLTDKSDGKVLIPVTDYDIVYTDASGKECEPAMIGSYNAVYTGKGYYTGTVKKAYKIVGKALSAVKLEGVKAAYLYTGAQVVPAAVFKDTSRKGYTDGYTLQAGEDKDYTVSYQDASKNTLTMPPQEPGRYTAVYTGRGYYTGSVSKAFTIARTALSKVQYSADASASKVAYDGTAKALTATLYDKDEKKTLVKDTDYTVTYTNAAKETVTPIGVGKYTATFTGTGSYTGTLTKTLEITGIPMSQVTIPVAGLTGSTLYDASAGGFVYTGEPILAAGSEDGSDTNGITLKSGDTILTKGSDYTVSYKNNIKAGTATAVFTGAGGYTGSVSRTYTIVKYAFGADITVYWIDESNLNKEELWVEAKDMNESTEAKYYFVKGGVKPLPVVRRGSDLLQEGVDYKLSWKNNTLPLAYNAAKPPTVTITGAGNLNGTLTRVYTILNKGGQPVMETTELTYQTAKPGLYKNSRITIKAGGKILTAGTDYYNANDSENPFIYTYETLPVIPGGSAVTTEYLIRHYDTVTTWSYKTIKPGDRVDPGDALPAFIMEKTDDGHKNIAVAGPTIIKVTAGGKGVYAGRTVTGMITVKNNINISKATVKIDDVTWTGAQVNPAVYHVTLKDGMEELTLVPGNHFQAYPAPGSENIKAGTGKMLLESDMNSNILGTRIVTYKINKYTMKDDGADPVTVKWVDAASPGVEKEWAAKGLTDENTPSYVYVKNGVKPHPIVYRGAEELEEGTDYRLAWKNNAKDGSFNGAMPPTVTITGTGSVAGSVSRVFTITDKGSEPVMEAPSLACLNNKTGAYKNGRITISADGQKLAAGTDYYAATDKAHPFRYYYDELPGCTEPDDTYIVQRYDTVTKKWGFAEVTEGQEINVNDCIPAFTVEKKDDGSYAYTGIAKPVTIRVEAAGKGYFNGYTIRGTYDMTASYAMSKAKVSVKNQAWTGSYIEPAEADVEVSIKEGTETCILKNGVDYMYSAAGFENTKLGKGSITVTPVDDRGLTGTATATFMILPKSLSGLLP